MTCSRCSGRMMLDYDKDFCCINCGYRPSVVLPLDVPREPPARYRNRKSGPRIGMMKL